MDAFDADVLIYAAQADNEPGRRVSQLFGNARGPGQFVGIGSVLLVPEVLSKPTRLGQSVAVDALLELLGQLDLLPVDVTTAKLAVDLGARHKLRTVDAVHLATAIDAGADRFITNNSRDFPQTIEGIAITYPQDLPDAA